MGLLEDKYFGAEHWCRNLCATTLSGDEGLEWSGGEISGHQGSRSRRCGRFQTLDDGAIPGDCSRARGERRGGKASVKRDAPAESASTWKRMIWYESSFFESRPTLKRYELF